MRYGLRRRHNRLLAVLLASAAVAVPAKAQVGRNDGDGPIVAGNPLQTQAVQGRAWTLEASMASIYDSNFRARTPAEPATRLTPLLRVGAGLPIGRQQLFFGADVGRDVFLGQPEFNRGRYALGGGLEWRVGTRCSGVVGAESLQRLVTVTEQAEFTNAVQKTNVIAGSLGCQTPTGLGFGVSAQRRSLTNDTPQRALFNLNSTVISPSISYGSPTIGQVSISAVINETRFPNRLIPSPDGIVIDGVDILQGRIGYSRGLGSRFQVAVGASYLKSSPKPSEVFAVVDNQIALLPREPFTGSGYDGSLSYQASRRLNINVAASRNVSVSANIGALFVVRTDFGGDLSYQIGPSLNFTAGGRFMQNRYRALLTAPSLVPRNSDTSRRFFANLDYSPVPLYSIGVGIAHMTRRSDPSIFDFSSTTVRLDLRVLLGR